MASLDINVRQANADFQSVKNNIIECGVEVIEGTPTAEYGGKVKEVFEAGRKAQYDEFWDNFTHNGGRTSYYRPFSNWGHVYIRPNTKIVPTNIDCGNQPFVACSNLKKIEANCIDFSQKPRGTKNTEGYYYTFYNCVSLEEIEDVGIQPDCGFTYTFANDEKLHTIAIIRCDENTTFPSAFNYCRALVNLVIEGTIGKNNLNLQWSTRLSKASWVSIVGCYSTTISGLSMTGSLASVNKAFETSEGANDGSTSAEWLNLIATKSNVSFNLV